MLFKRIKDFDSYWISLNGDVYSDKSNKILKQVVDIQPSPCYC